MPLEEVNLFLLLHVAILENNLSKASSLCLDNPNLLDRFATCRENPLLLACDRGSLDVAAEIHRHKPGFAYKAMVLLLASTKVNLGTVKALLSVNPQLCNVEDESFMIPLQTAVINGHAEIIRALVSVSPESLEKLTLEDETVLHLAVKNYRRAALEVLMEEIQKRNQHHIIDKQDHEGNSVLHIAVSDKLVEIVESLRRGIPLYHFVKQAKSSNKSGFTALNLYSQMTFRDLNTQRIGEILYEAIDAEEHLSRARPATETVLPQSPHTPNKRSRPSQKLEDRSVLLTTVAMIGGLAAAVTFNFPDALIMKNLVENATYPVRSVIFLELPPIFYHLVFITECFMASMGIVVVLTWWLPFGSMILVMVISMSIVFVMAVDHVMPKFSVKVGSRDISSFQLVWIVAIVFALFGIVVVSTVKWLIRLVFKDHKTQKETVNLTDEQKGPVAEERYLCMANLV